MGAPAPTAVAAPNGAAAAPAAPPAARAPPPAAATTAGGAHATTAAAAVHSVASSAPDVRCGDVLAIPCSHVGRDTHILPAM
jgi:hypothetical protein